MDQTCWVIAVLVLVVMAVFAFIQMRRPPAAASSRSARKTVTTSSHDASSPAAAKKGAMLQDAFGTEIQIQNAMERVVDASSYQVDESLFMKEFIGADETTFRPIDKEQAMKSANARPAQHMQSGRPDTAPPSRTIGLDPMAFARTPIPRPAHESAACIPFNDNDHRIATKKATPECESDAQSHCPWE